MADEYIERLVWRTPGGGSRGGPEAFDPKRWNKKKFFPHRSNLVHISVRIEITVEIAFNIPLQGF